MTFESRFKFMSVRRRNFLFSLLTVFAVTYSGYHHQLSQLSYVLLAVMFFTFYVSRGINTSVIILMLLLTGILVLQILLNELDLFSKHSYRFIIVLNLLTLVALVKTRFFSINAFFIVATLHSIMLFCISATLTLYAITFADELLWLGLRSFVQNMEFGDIWTNNVYYYRVQLLGNPMVYALLCFTTVFYRPIVDAYSIGFARILFSVSLLGTIAAGNVNYLLGMILCIIYFVCKLEKRLQKFVITIALTASSPIFLVYLINLIAVKFAPGAQSGSHRIDLLNTFMFVIGQEPLKFLLGFGVNNTLPGIINPVIHGAHYIELQLLLLNYKIGILLFLILTLVYVMAVYKNYGKEAIFFVSFYIFGSLANPYLFDTQHIIVTLLCSTGLVHYWRQIRK